MLLGVIFPYQVSFSQIFPKGYIRNLHEKWISQHGRVYKDAAEKKMRFRIFKKKNVQLIEVFNRGEDKGFKLAVNHFADITDDEFRNLHDGFNSSMKASSLAMSTTKDTFKYANVKRFVVLCLYKCYICSNLFVYSNLTPSFHVYRLLLCIFSGCSY